MTIYELEIWLIGTPDQLDRATTVLAAIGRNAESSARQRLAGNDNGRARQYLRLTVATTPVVATVRRPALRPVADQLDATT